MKRIIFFLTGLLFISSTSFSQNNSNMLLKSLQNKFNSINDLSADFKQSTNGRINLVGKFFYKKENDLRLELRNLMIVSDGTTNWSYNKKENKVIISNYDPSDPSIISLKRIIEDYPAKCEVSDEKENGNNVLVLKPGKPGMNFKIAKIFINSSDLVQKIILTDQNDALIQIEFSNYKLNQKLNNSTFTFIPPKGSKVIDLR
ncbi:MAG: outer membrane lipoprotein carrier protein LolA [Bacteroidetes bacterium]|nr:outer membrane lipoprotein carrier protein LolA [Bacteroidota bacterium]